MEAIAFDLAKRWNKMPSEIMKMPAKDVNFDIEMTNLESFAGGSSG